MLKLLFGIPFLKKLIAGLIMDRVEKHVKDALFYVLDRALYDGADPYTEVKEFAQGIFGEDEAPVIAGAVGELYDASINQRRRVQFLKEEMLKQDGDIIKALESIDFNKIL